MGRYLKYSSGYWLDKTKTLSEAEENMLNLYIERAGVQDGQDILDLGCGWGSFSLFAARKFPNAKITAVSNSAIQRKFIEERVKQWNLKNLEIVIRDINQLALDKKYDRIISIEMFEHMRNYEKLLEKVSSFLQDDGALFVHIFTHQTLAYLLKITTIQTG